MRSSERSLPRAQRFFDFPVMKLDNTWPDQPAAESRVYVVQTASRFIQR